jgi:hypothetical protein
MNLRVLASAAGVIGGLCWVARWVADLASGNPAWGVGAHLAGLVLLGLALAGVGAGLVSRSATWLRLIVAVAFPLLVWSVYVVVRGEGEGIGLDGVLGAAAVLWSAASLVVARRHRDAEEPPAPDVRRRPGSHAR